MSYGSSYGGGSSGFLDRPPSLLPLVVVLILILFMMAAFRSRSLPIDLRRAHVANFEVPRPIMCVVGVANGRLSLDVMRFSRRRRFFFCRLPDPSPSTSACGRTRLFVWSAAGAKVAEEKLSLEGSVIPVEKGKLSRLSLHLTVRHSKSIATKDGIFHYRDADAGAKGRRTWALVGEGEGKGCQC